MSEKKTNKAKWTHKLHQLQKRIHRMIENESEDHTKEGKRKGLLKKIRDRINSKK